MNIAGLINRFGGDRQDYEGACYSSAHPSQPRAFTATVELLRNDDSIFFEGAIAVEGHRALSPYRLSVPFSSMTPAGGRAELSHPDLGLLTGPFLTNGAGFEFLARSDSKLLSLHLSFEGQVALFSVSGMVEVAAHTLAFSAAPASQWQATAQAKVYSLRRRL